MPAAERRVKCPSCTREIRVTEDELLDKRSFCAACGARFELMEEIFVGDGPFRGLQVARAELAPQPPTSKMRQVGQRIIVDSARPFPYMQLAFLVFWFGFLVAFYARALHGGHLIALLFPLLHVGVGLWLLRGVVRDLRGRETLTLGPDGIAVERRDALLTSVKRLSYQEIQSTRVEAQPVGPRSFDALTGNVNARRLLLLRPGQDPVVIGDHLGHGQDAMEWVEQRVRDRQREK